jgi:hypothetical protein
MVCPTCHNGTLVVIPAEIRLYRNSPRTLSHPPMTPSPDIHICLECGAAEFTVPQSWLSAGWLGSKRAKNVTPMNESKSSPIFAA